VAQTSAAAHCLAASPTCAMLMGDPLEPHWDMMSGELCQWRVSMHT
jgi:hypothetical protein